MKIIPYLTILFIILLIPINTFANAGLPIIATLNFYSFTVGAIFILTIEYQYLKKVFKNVEKLHLAVCILKINFASTLFGVFIIPAVMFLIQLEPFIYFLRGTTSSSTMSVIWVVSLTVNFVFAFISTVYIEYQMLSDAPFCNVIEDDKIILKHVIKFNALSYIFLVLLVFVTVSLFKSII